LLTDRERNLLSAKIANATTLARLRREGREENAKFMLKPTDITRFKAKMARMLDELPTDLKQIMWSRHLMKVHLRKIMTWKIIREMINMFYDELYDEYEKARLNMSDFMEIFKICVGKKGSKNYYWRESISLKDGDIFEVFEDPYFPIRGIKGGYIRTILKKAIDADVVLEIPNNKDKAWDLEKIRTAIERRLGHTP
jgi:hypothetical protein